MPEPRISQELRERNAHIRRVGRELAKQANASLGNLDPNDLRILLLQVERSTRKKREAMPKGWKW